MKKEIEFFRNCPKCDKVLSYKNKYFFNQVQKKKSLCIVCCQIGIQAGAKNAFYGKTHSKEARGKMSKAMKGHTHSRRPEVIEKTRNFGKENGMYGKSFYDVWLEKYGKEEADKRLIEHKKKKSIKAKGKNNPMYGRPSPVGSGNGWGGWYKGWYFRSLRELCYMVNTIEKNNYEWENAECNKLSIKYIDEKGSERTYRADFLVNRTQLIEIKPKKLQDTTENRLKKEAALKFCDENNMEYYILDVEVDDGLIEKLYKDDIIKFNKTTEIKAIKKWVK